MRRSVAKAASSILGDVLKSQALARVWRPKNFDAVLGQDHVVKGLQYALAHHRLHHAYLFTGTRGVGKTTLARIFAKCLSCETGITGTPCGECSICRQIEQGAFLDLIEIDAASRTKVEDTRDLLDKVQYAPTLGRFKIYLIDEVHMLSTHSFNALLKTLEEPPEHVKFLLATTDPQKLPITVLSRCLQYHLRPVSPEVLRSHLAEILNREGIPYEADALSTIALRARGSVRDALSVLDQAIAFTGGNLSAEEVLSMLGGVSRETVYVLAQAIAKGEAESGLKTVEKLRHHFVDFENLLDELARFWQLAALAQKMDVLSSEYFEWNKIQEISKLVDPLKLQLFYEISIKSKTDLIFAPDPFSGFQMVILRLLAFELTEPFPTKEIEIKKTPVAKTRATEPKIQNLGTQKKTGLDWDAFVQSLPVEGVLRQIITHTKLERLEENQMTLITDLAVECLLSEKIVHRLSAAIEAGLGRKVSLVIRSSGASDLATPAKRVQQKVEARHAEASAMISEDTSVQEIRDVFGAEVDQESVEFRDKK